MSFQLKLQNKAKHFLESDREPGNPKYVHSIIVYLVPKGLSIFNSMSTSIFVSASLLSSLHKFVENVNFY